MTAEAKVLLKNAVQHSSTKRQGVLERMFTYWFNGFVYNQIWEDPVVDMKALQLSRDSRILTISSGGCNVLAYLTQSPASIDAVDLNPYHLELTRLKLVAVQHLPNYESFYEFFGKARSKTNVSNYFAYIAPHLTLEQREFWENRRGFLSPRIQYFEKGLYDVSRSGYFIRFLHSICRFANCKPEKILAANTMEEQERLFSEYLEPVFSHLVVRILGPVSPLLFSLGIPPKQFQALRAEHPDGIVALYCDRVKRLACRFPIQTNYFAWQAFCRQYSTDWHGFPEYLKPENYEVIRENAHRVRLHNIGLTAFLHDKAPETLSHFIFLDSQDW
ncbi:MAG: BtaA family protein, partial [Bdellovibrionales bacterium]|nr:BtaA family protein [Bdellovibrionales bacterium]